jgi:hypothetical protein
MGFVKVGNVSFAVEHLKGVTLAECQTFFSHIRKDIVKIAWDQVNPKTKGKPKNND